MNSGLKRIEQRLDDANKKYVASLPKPKHKDRKEFAGTMKMFAAKLKDMRRGTYIELNTGVKAATGKIKTEINKAFRKLNKTENHMGKYLDVIKSAFESRDIMTVEYQNGAQVKLGNYAAMLARTSRIETDNVNGFMSALEDGTDLVQCIGQSPTCELCAIYRGRVFSITGKNKDYPPLYDGENSPLRDGYNAIHPNCRCQFIPYYPELETKEQVEKDKARSNEPFVDNRTKQERDEYAAWQATNRKLWSEQTEYERMKNVLGDKMPYTTLAGFRRAKREESGLYLASKALYIVQKRHISNLTKARENGIINIQIDELTPCLRDNATGKLLDTQFSIAGIEQLAGLKKQGWKFDWLRPIRDGDQVVQLRIKGDRKIQGLIAFKDVPNDHAIYVDLVESAPTNIGSDGKYKGVGGHLFAIACRESVRRGYGGFVYFDSKTNLIDHYKKELGAMQISGQRMYISNQAAEKLIRRYFKNG